VGSTKGAEAARAARDDDDSRAPHRRKLLIAAFCLTLAFGCVAPALFAYAQSPATPTVDVTFTGQPQPIPRSFFGLSIEYTELGQFEQLGPAFDNVIAMLRPGDGSPLELRLGGRSADEVVWTGEPAVTNAPHLNAYATPSLSGEPKFVKVITPAWLGELAALVHRDNLVVEPELNLAVHSPAMAVQFTRAVRAALPAGTMEGVSIGDEPDLYRKEDWLQKERISSTIASTPRQWTVGYSAASYRADYLSYARPLRQAFPGLAISAPDITHPAESWSEQLLDLGNLEPTSIAVHRYATATCTTKTVKVPTPLAFLDDRYTHGLATTVIPDLELVKAHDLPFRVTEMNSFTCGGRKQIAESFATALWAPDALFEMMDVGVDGISWHIHPAMPNSPFHVTAQGIVALPELYGLAVFAQMIGPDAQLEPVALSNTLNLTLKVWAVHTTEGLKVLALNKGSQPVIVRIHDPGAAGTGQLGMLTAPTLSSETGVTFAGQSIGSDGRWQGHRVETSVSNQQGVFTFRLPPFTGGLLTVRR
jgi:hypothetical protein